MEPTTAIAASSIRKGDTVQAGRNGMVKVTRVRSVGHNLVRVNWKDAAGNTLGADLSGVVRVAV